MATEKHKKSHLDCIIIYLHVFFFFIKVKAHFQLQHIRARLRKTNEQHLVKFYAINIINYMCIESATLIGYNAVLPWYGTGKKKRLSYLVGNLVATNWPIEKALFQLNSPIS